MWPDLCHRFSLDLVLSIEVKRDAHEALEKLIQDHGIPNHIIPDNTPELVAGEFKRKGLKYGTTLKPIEAWMPNQNLAESAIRELKRSYQ